MGDVGNLLAGIGTVIGSLVSAATLAWAMIRASRKERSTTANKTAAAIADALDDGQFTPDEVAKIRALMEGNDE